MNVFVFYKGGSMGQLNTAMAFKRENDKQIDSALKD
jgi:hypothetical protein